MGLFRKNGLSDFPEYELLRKAKNRERRTTIAGVAVGGFIGLLLIFLFFALGILIWAGIVALCWWILTLAFAIPGPNTVGVFAIAFVAWLIRALTSRGNSK